MDARKFPLGQTYIRKSLIPRAFPAAVFYIVYYIILIYPEYSSYFDKIKDIFMVKNKERLLHKNCRKRPVYRHLRQFVIKVCPIGRFVFSGSLRGDVFDSRLPSLSYRELYPTPYPLPYIQEGEGWVIQKNFLPSP